MRPVKGTLYQQGQSPPTGLWCPPGELHRRPEPEQVGLAVDDRRRLDVERLARGIHQESLDLIVRVPELDGHVEARLAGGHVELVAHPLAGVGHVGPAGEHPLEMPPIAVERHQ